MTTHILKFWWNIDKNLLVTFPPAVSKRWFFLVLGDIIVFVIYFSLSSSKFD